MSRKAYFIPQKGLSEMFRLLQILILLDHKLREHITKLCDNFYLSAPMLRDSVATFSTTNAPLGFMIREFSQYTSTTNGTYGTLVLDKKKLKYVYKEMEFCNALAVKCLFKHNTLCFIQIFK